MTLLELAHEVRKQMREFYELEVEPCPRPAYDRVKRRFAVSFGFELPDAYWTIMSVVNGVKFNGATICPAIEHPRFKETIIQFNESMRDTFYEGFVYLGKSDEELYVWDEKRRIYCATEFVGRPIWKEFASAEAMYVFLLKRCMDLDLPQ